MRTKLYKSRGSILFNSMVVCLLLVPARAQQKSITVAAAADLSTAFNEIGAEFQKQKGIEVKFSFGASGALTQQIENGAPFDDFFSADMGFPQRLISEGQASSSTLYRYAVGKLVLWEPADSPLDLEKLGLDALSDPSVQKIAIANPDRAPYGRAAVAALKHAGLYDRISARLVTAENIAQAAQFVESSNAQIGFVALAHALAPEMKGKGKYWIVPAEDYPPIDQGAVVLTHSAHKEEAAAFLDFVKTQQAADILQRFGFTLPSAK